MMNKTFNVTGVCIPDKHYTADISVRLREITEKFIDPGKYFTINRARQYGKTTTLYLLEKCLQENYLVISLSFEAADDLFSSRYNFAAGFIRRIGRRLRQLKLPDSIQSCWNASVSREFPMEDLSDRISELCNTCRKKIVLMIDEVDKNSDNQIFLSFLGMLRTKYLDQQQGLEKTFHSVILAGVYDIKNLKLKLHPKEESKYNSPWNVAADFDINMELSVAEIQGMLKEYADDRHQKIDTVSVAQEIYDYTSGYPFLVSKICKRIDEDITLEDRWSKHGVSEAVKLILNENNTLFDDMRKKITEYPNLREMLYAILFQGQSFAYNPDNFVIDIGCMFGFIKESDGKAIIANRIFETRLYNLFLSEEMLNNQTYLAGAQYKSRFRKNDNDGGNMGTQRFQWDKMTMGTCYYPEHWDRSLWQDDLRRMKEAGITVIRIAEFAWAILESEEGCFQFGFFDEFLELCRKEDMKVIFGTPTATPPAWLTEKYPEVLNARQDGILLHHGARRHYNYNSKKYQELCAKIVTEIAMHYGQNPVIVGWQIDNEINCETDEFYSEADTLAFREFLKEKYGTLEALNQAWGTVFWSQTYTAWEQLYVPRPVLSDGYNPHLRLDYIRFVSESANRFCKMQADILRKYKRPEAFVTTNGLFGNLDNHRMEEESLDVYTYDSYPNFAFGLEGEAEEPYDLKDRRWTKNLIEVRSICPHFGIMEQQSGANGWTTRMEKPSPRPGQLMLWAMQSVAQGAEYISFFRWRTCTFGTEMYWHGILDYDNRDNRKLSEVKDFYEKLRKLDVLCGSRFTAAFGVVRDYDNIWDAKVDVWHQRVENASSKAIFAAAELNHTPYDVVYLRDNTTLEELTEYPVLIYAHPVIMTEERAKLLKAYVEQGGTLVIGCRSGYKQENGKCVMFPQPGLLAEITGSDVKDFTFTSNAEEPVTAEFTDEKGRSLEMPLFNDIMEIREGAEATRVLAVYKGSYYEGRPAVIEKQTGKGRGIHFGAAFSRQNVKEILEYTGVLEPFADTIHAPEGVQVVQRTKDEHRYLFVLNFQATQQEIVLKKELRSLYNDQVMTGEVVLKPFETNVFEVNA